MSRHQITPAWQTSRGSIVRASGCAAGVPVAGARVFGQTRQNLWVNPSGTNSGVTATETDDGALTLSGTASGFVSIVAETFALKPSTAYTLSVDKDPGTEATATLNVREKRADGSYIDPQHNASTGGVTFTTSADMASCECRLVVISGTAVSGTYRIMLNEGSSAEPWCPPGLSSVSELSVVSAGRNLLSNTFSGIAYAGGVGVSSGTMRIPEALMGETVTVSVYKDGAPYESTGSQWGFYMGRGPHGEATDEMVTLVPTGRTGVVPFVPSGTFMFYANNSFSSGPCTIDVMLELGSTATAYEPPHVTTTPIDLSGHELRSLPDGTRDVLAVDGSGAVVVEQAVKCVTIDGTNVKASNKNNFQFSLNWLYKSIPVSDEGVAEIFCDSLPVVSAANIWEGSSIGIGVNASGTIVFAPPGNLSTIEEANAWLAQHPVTVIYPVATTTTVPLDPITPPTVPAPDATLWAASDVPCDLEATTWTASGAEQGRQQAAMVKVAQQVRQQAETVAALTTQALEA